MNCKKIIFEILCLELSTNSEKHILVSYEKEKDTGILDLFYASFCVNSVIVLSIVLI